MAAVKPREANPTVSVLSSLSANAARSALNACTWERARLGSGREPPRRGGRARRRRSARDFSERIPEVCESVSRSRGSIITAKRRMRKGEKKRFTNEKRREKKKRKEGLFPRARDALGPGQGIFCSIQPTVILTGISRGARFSSQPPGSEGKRGEEEPPFFTLKKKKPERTATKKKKEVSRTHRQVQQFLERSVEQRLGTPLGSARNTAMNPNGIPADLRIRSRTSCQVAAFAETKSRATRAVAR